MRYPIYALQVAVALLALGCGGNARAQLLTADEFFHGGAQRFLTNNIPGALEVVTNGLQRFPDDEKLQKLYELLNQQQQQNQQNQQDQKQEQQKDQQEKKDDQKQEQKDSQDKKDQPDKSDQQKQEEEKKKQDEQKKKEQEKKEQQKQSGDKSKDQGKPEEKPGEQQPMEAHAMTPQEAKQLLDAQKGDEQVLIFQPQGEPKNRTKQLKDW